MKVARNRFYARKHLNLLIFCSVETNVTKIQNLSQGQVGRKSI